MADYSNYGYYASPGGSYDFMDTDANTGQETVNFGYYGQNGTMRDFYDANPLDDGEMRLNNFKFRVPPDAISVDQFFGPTVMSARTIRQPNSIKFASGKLVQSIVLSIVFPDQGDKQDLEVSSLLDLIVLFKGAPFCAVQNKLLNETYGVGALALRTLQIETIPNFPNSYRAVISCQAFNWKVYVDSEDFASMINYPMYLTYIARGRALYIEKSKQENYEPPPFSHGWEGIDEEWENRSYEFDLKFLTKAPVDLFFDTDAISAGDSLSVIKEYLKSLPEYNRLGLDVDATDTYSIREILSWVTSFGLLSEDGQVYGGDAANQPISFDRVAALLDYMGNYLDQDKIEKLAEQLKSYDRDMEDAVAVRQATAYLAQIGFDEWERIAEESSYGDPLYTPKVPWGDETELKLTGLNLSQSATVTGIGVTMSNIITSLPIQMAEGGALQYMGSDDTYVQVSLLLHGEGPDSDLSKLIAAFRLQQSIVRATKSVVCTGFIGMDSPLTILCGMRTFLPISLKTSTVAGYPGIYQVVLQLVDFDLYQQDRERLEKLNMSAELAGIWRGHPALRFIDQSDKFNLYPDLYLEHSEGVGWEQPDFYFIASPPYMPSKIVSNQDLAVSGLGASLSLSFSGNKTTFTVNGEDVPFVQDIIVSPVEEGPNSTQTNADIDFGANMAEAYEDYCSSSLRGYMRQAFPTFFFALIDEPRQILMYRTYTDFYSRRGVSQIVVNRSIDPMQEVAIIQLSDIYRRLSFDPNPRNKSSVHNAAWWASTLYGDLQKLTEMLGGDVKVEAVELQPGMRVHLRMGFSNRIRELKTVFNGTITEITPQSEGRDLTITAQGDGRELLGVINSSDKGHDTADVSGLFYSEPRELIIRLLTMRSSVFRNALSLISGGAWHPDPKNGIRHFGELLPNKPFDLTEAQEADKRKLAEDFEARGLKMIGEEATDLSQNIVGASSTQLAITEGEMNIGEIESTNIEISIDNASLLTALRQAIEGLWNGWDQNIFSRNIYPGTGSGLLENFEIPLGGGTPGLPLTTTTTITPPSQILTGGGGGSLFDQILYAIADTLDFTSAIDEPSFKAYTYMRTTWDIIQQCSDIVPNYITAVRPFMHRSTLYYGKPFWKYTSGVTPVGGWDSSGQFIHKFEKIEEVANRLGYYKVKYTTDSLKADTEKVSVPMPITQVTTPGTDVPVYDEYGNVISPGTSGTGSGQEAVNGDWLNGQFETADSRMNRMIGLGDEIAAWSSQYGVPWQLVLGMAAMESEWGTTGGSARRNNPGNITYTDTTKAYRGVTGNEVGVRNWAVFDSMSSGIEAMFRLLSEPWYQKYLSNGDVDGALKLWLGDPGPTTTVPEYVTNVKQQMSIWDQRVSTSGGAAVPSGTSVKSDGRIGVSGVVNPNVPMPETQGGEAQMREPEAYQWALDYMSDNENYNLQIRGILDNGDWWDAVKTSDWDADGAPDYSRSDVLKDYVTMPLASRFREYMMNGEGAVYFGWYLDSNGIDRNDIQAKDFNGFMGTALQSLFKDYGVRIAPHVTNGEVDGITFVNETGQILDESVFSEWMAGWQNNYPEGIPDGSGSFWDTVKNIPGIGWLVGKAGEAIDLIKAILGAIGNVFSKLGKFVKGVIQLGYALTKTVFSLAQITQYMSDFSKLMASSLYDSNYKWGTVDNPFSREFGEPVLEIREPFCKFHRADSLHNIVANNISVSDAEVYPVVTSVSKGEKGKTVYADKSIAPEFQKELVYENSLNFDLLNWRDGVHAKRIGLAACARSLRTMYQGSIDLIGDPRMEPWDMFYIADLATNMWGVCNVREVTHNMSADTGYVSQVAVMPIVAVDDPAQWAVSTVANDFFKRIFGNQDFDKAASQAYWGKDDVQAMMDWVDNNPDAQRPTWYNVYVGAGVTVSIALFVAAIALTGGTAAPFLVGTMGATGLGGILSPETLAGLVQYFDEQQDVWISLLTKNGEPYQAGLTGATGIVIGRQKSTGLDILDMFSRDQPILTMDELLKRMGMTDAQIKQWTLDLDYYRNKTIFELINQDFFESVWNPSDSEGYIRWENAEVVEVTDGDTIVVRFNGVEQTIRLAGIDAPEYDHQNPSNTPKGVAAQAYLAGLIPVGSNVTVYLHPQFQKEEEYGRWMGFVVGPSGTNTSADMLASHNAQLWGGTE